MKTIKIPKKELIREHKRIIPQLKRKGLKEEALKQAKELKEYKHK